MFKPLVDYSKPQFCGCGSSIRSAGVSVELMNVAQRSARGRSPCAAAPQAVQGRFQECAMKVLVDLLFYANVPNHR